MNIPFNKSPQKKPSNNQLVSCITKTGAGVFIHVGRYNKGHNAIEEFGMGWGIPWGCVKAWRSSEISASYIS